MHSSVAGGGQVALGDLQEAGAGQGAPVLSPLVAMTAFAVDMAVGNFFGGGFA